MHGSSERGTRTFEEAGRTGGHALSIIIPIEPSRLDDLERLLNEIGRNVRQNPYIDFSKLTTAHFLRWVILPPKSGHEPMLAFESNHDGTTKEHLEELLLVGGWALRLIYSHCERYLPEYDREPGAFLAYLLRHEKKYTAFFRAYPGWTTQGIRQNAQVRQGLQQLVDFWQRKQLLSRVRQADFEQLQDMIHRTDWLKPAPPPRLPRTWKERLTKRIMKSRPARYGTSLLLLPVLALVLPALAAALRYREWLEQRHAQAKLPEKRALVEIEDRRTAQSPLTHLVDIKAGWFRLQLLKRVLGGIEFMCKYYCNEGDLGGITTIHFARWIILEGPGDRHRLLFFSNYDGSWERYLGEFIDEASRWLTAIWSNTHGFPKTSLLFWRGARDEEEFKQWVREHQLPTQVWYSAHADESVRNILQDIQLCSKLKRPMPRDAFEQWLGLL